MLSWTCYSLGVTVLSLAWGKIKNKKKRSHPDLRIGLTLLSAVRLRAVAAYIEPKTAAHSRYPVTIISH